MTVDLHKNVITQLLDGLGNAATEIEMADPIKWIDKEFLIPETRSDPKLRGHLHLEDYQRDALVEALSKDENGNFKYSIIVWSDIKKSIKSTIAAAVTLARATTTEYGEYFVVANDLKQADSRVAQYIRRAIQLNPKMQKRYTNRGYRITCPSGSFIEAIPIDPSGEAGSNADQVVFSELWGANQEAQQNMWAEMTIPPAKYGRAFRWIESYAGFTGQSKLLYSLYELGVLHGEKLWPDKLYPVTGGSPSPLELFVNRQAGMLCLWNTQPRCPWQTPAYYASEEAIMLPNQFKRIHRNQWVSSEESFVPMEWWYACRRADEEWPAWNDKIFNPKKYSMVLAMDAATSSDNFGMWMGCRHPTKPDEVLTIYARRWEPSDVTHKIDFVGTDEKPGPEKELERLIREYNIVEVAYDPYQLYDMASRWKKKGLAWFREFSQGEERLLADSQFRSLIREKRFWHRGEKELTEHISNANADTGAQENKVRLVKKEQNQKIDLAVTASMGSHEILRLNL